MADRRSKTERQRVYRERKRRGARMRLVEVPEDLTQALVMRDLIDPSEIGDADAESRAIGELLQEVAEGA